MNSVAKPPSNRQRQASQAPGLDALHELRREGPAAGVDHLLIDVLGQLCREIGEIRALLEGKTKSHYSVEELAEITGRSAYTIRRWIGEARIRAIRVSGTGPKGRLLIPRAELERLVTSGLAGEVPAALID